MEYIKSLRMTDKEVEQRKQMLSEYNEEEADRQIIRSIKDKKQRILLKQLGD